MDHSNVISLILNEIKKVEDHEVSSISYGAHVVGVESRKMGLATWSGGRHPVSLENMPEAGQQSSAKALAEYLKSDNPLESSLGLAAVNSLLPDAPKANLINVNAGDLILELGKNKKVAVIGHFPFVAKMQQKFDDLMVFEKLPGKGDLEEKLIPEKLPEADLIAITATTISNKTLGNILDYCSPNSIKMLIGPSTPVNKALFDLGFHYLAGSIVEDKKTIKEGIIAGYPFKHLKGVQHVILKKLTNKNPGQS